MRISHFVVNSVLIVFPLYAAAVPVYWDINFYDSDFFYGPGDDDYIIGTGEFSYDTDDSSSDNLFPLRSPYYTQEAVRYPLTSFEATINGLSWSLDSSDWIKGVDYYLSQNTEGDRFSIGDGYVDSQGYGGDSWLFRENAEPYSDALFLNNASYYIENPEYSLYGSFIQDVNYYYDGIILPSTIEGANGIPTYGYYPGEGSAGGSWVATLRTSSIPAVPVPATLPLFGIGLAGLMWAGSRQRKRG